MIQSRQIEAFRAVMLTGSMTAAARAINVSQPAVSRLVRDLEAELGLVLFHRSGNTVVPTAQAEALSGEVERAFIGLAEIRAFASELRMGRGGSLRIAALPAMAADFLPRFAARFSRDRPSLKIVIDGLPSPLIRERVEAGHFDIGITAFPFQQSGLSVVRLVDHAVVAMPTGHRLAARPVVRAADLHDENLILLTKFTKGHHPVEVELQSVRRRTALETPLSSIACVLVSEGVGVAIVDPFSASAFVGRGVVLRKFAPALEIGSAVIHSSTRELSMIAREFRTAFIEHAEGFLRRAEYLGGG